MNFSGIDIYWNKPYQVPSFGALEVSQGLLDQYAGVYAAPGKPVKMKVSKTGSTIAIENNGSAIPLEATAPNKFNLAPGVTVEFDIAKKNDYQAASRRRGIY